MKGIFTGLGMLVLVALAFGIGWVGSSNLHRKEAEEVYLSQIRAAEFRLGEEKQRSRALEDEVKARTETIVDLEGQIARLEMTGHSTPAIKKPDTGSVFNVRAYLGTTYIGDAELLFTRARQTVDAQGNARVTQEPVVRLPEKFRSTFTEIKTNIVEKEVVREVAQNNSSTYIDNRGNVPALWGYGTPQLIQTLTPLQGQSDPNFNPRVINDELKKPRVRNGVVVPPAAQSTPPVSQPRQSLPRNRQGLIQQPLLTPAASIRTNR